MKKADILIVTNAAGELSAWVKPIVEALATSWPEACITIVLTPSQFVTGAEEAYARNLPGVDRVLSVSEFKQLLWKGRATEAIRGCILSLGGDLLYPVLLKWRLGYPAFAYVENRKQWKRQYTRFFTRDDVGDLMVDSLPHMPPPLANPGESRNFTIALLPGSRDYHTRYMIPFFTEVANILKEKHPNLNFVWKLSPFMPADAHKELDRENLEPRTLNVEQPVSDFPSQTDFSNIDLALTIPGTNTAQLAICGIPMLSVMPLNWPREIPLEGIWEFLGRLPLIGAAVKKWLLTMVCRRRKYLTLPNILAQDRVVPELWGDLEPVQVAQEVGKLLEDITGRQKISQRCQEVMGERGAAQKIVAVMNTHTHTRRH